MFGPYSGSPWIFTDAANLGYWSAQSLQAGTAVVTATNVDYGFSRVQVVFDRTTPVGTREDVIVTTLAFAAAMGTTCAPLSVGDKAVCDTALAAWWTTMKVVMSNQYTLREFRWYDYSPITTRPGPVDRITASGVAGSVANGRYPDQLAVTTTYKTASRKHWGRSYWPFPGTASIDAVYGRVSSATTTTVQGALRTLLQVSGGTGAIQPVVASVGYHGVLGIRELQTDDVADVIRSRRAKNAVIRRTNTS